MHRLHWKNMASYLPLPNLKAKPSPGELEQGDKTLVKYRQLAWPPDHINPKVLILLPN
jgi:hypothetical protein